MKAVNLEMAEIEQFLNELGIAFGGRSMLTWKIIGMALRSRVEVAWYNINTCDAINKIMASEARYWDSEEHVVRCQEPLVRAEIIAAYNSYN
jgi:hypothetical protein